MTFSIVALAVVALAGVKLPIKLPGSGSGDAPKIPGVSATSDADKRTLELYKTLDYTNSGDGTEAETLFGKFGIPTGYNPKMHIANPDTEWIPQWDSLQLTDESRVAVCQAAINKSWTAKCHADFSEYRAAWKKIETEARPELQKLSRPGNYYARASGLAALMERVEKQAADAKALYPAGYGPANVGIQSEIVAAMVDLHREAKREFLTAEYLAGHKINLADYRERGRAFADDEVERDLFCSAAQKSGTQNGTPKLPVMFEMGKGLQVVRWPVQNDREAVIKKARTALLAATGPKLVTREVKAASLTNGSLPEAADAKLYWVFAEEGQSGLDSDSPFKVKSVKALAGGGVTAEIENLRVRTLPYDCRSTNKVDRIDDNGRVIYQQICKYQRVEHTRLITAQIPELPTGVELKAGDLVGFYGDLMSRKESTVSSTPPKKVTRETFTFTVRHLDRVKRAGKVLTDT